MPKLNQGLADAVRRWLADHGELTQAAISANGGPSSTTMTKILKGYGEVRQKALADLDRGLGWGAGRAAAALHGEQEDVRLTMADVPDEVLTGELTRRLAERARLLNERTTDGRADTGAEEAAEPGQESPGAGGGEGRAGAPMTKGDVTLAARYVGQKMDDQDRSDGPA